MMLQRVFNQVIARLAAKCPPLTARLVNGYRPPVMAEPPWTPAVKPLPLSRIALVTTAGIHHGGQPPFDMRDKHGDPGFRVLDSATIASDYTITHDYYDHRDADKDLNVVFPLARLAELASAGRIGAVNTRHFSFMGHIVGPHIDTLINTTAPRAAAMLVEDHVDAVVLTPA